MAKQKFYAVKCGRNSGIYKTWEECRRQVIGYSSAVYKSFATLAEAEAFMQDGQRQILDTPDEDRVKIYVDGSFDVNSGMFSYGMVALIDGGELIDCKAFSDRSLSAMRNVAGEIKGAMAAMQFCIDRGIKDVIIFYDYEGIAKWARGEWKAAKDGTRAYVEFYNSVKDDLNVEFRHVKGHSGDKYNEMADSLAKKALGII